MNILRSLRVGSLLGFAVAAGMFVSSARADVWINEINYDDAGTDTNEFVEVAGTAGTDLSNYQIVLYNGSGGAPYDTIALSGSLTDDGCGFGAATFDATGIQNGAPDGIALVDVTAGVTSVVQFLSYEGTFTGVGGPADSVLSTDIGVADANVGNDILALTGSGSAYADFTWAVNADFSVSALNDGQTISPCGGTAPFVSVTTAPATVPNDTVSYDVDGTANTNVVGELSWTNDLTGGSGQIAAATNWSISAISLDVGANLITVSGTNDASESSSDSATITRDTLNVSFTASADAVSEDVGTYVVTITKSVASGTVTGQVTLGGDATEGVGNDYTVDTTDFTMDGVTTSATFTVTVNDDVDVEPAETITLTLANVDGAVVGSPSVFTLTINASDAPPSPLFISEVADPGDGTSARFVELYNAGGSAIDLGAGTYYLARQVNGTSLTNNMALTGTVAAASTYVIAQELVGFQAAYPGIDFDQVESGVDGNGDDAYMLYSGGDSDAGSLVDIYGEFGVDGTLEPWVYENSRAVRTDSVTQANTTWTEAEWIIPGSADIVDMTPGAHPDSAVVVNTNVSFTIAADSVSEGVGTYIVTVAKSLALGTVTGQVAISGDATEGGGDDFTIDTTDFTMDGVTTTATFTITINDDGDTEAAETIVLTLANVDGGTVVTPSVFTLTISPSDIPAVGIADFRFNDAPYLQVSAQAANIVVSNMTLSTGGTISENQTTTTDFPDLPYISESGGWTADNQAGAKAYEFTIEPASGYKVSITGISFSAYATGAGPSGYGYDINGGAATFADDMPDSSIVHVTNAVTGVNDVTAPIGILIQGWTNGTRVTSGNGDFRIDDVVIFGLVELVGGGGSTTLDDYNLTGITQAGGSLTVTIDVTSNGVPYSLVYSTDILINGAPVGTGVADTQNGDGGSITLEDTTPGDDSRLYWIDTNVSP